jgi:hypothetical protein
MGWYGGGGGGTLPSAAPWTLEGNPSASTSTITAFTIGGLAGKTTPAGTDQLLLQDNAASGALKFVNWSNLPSGGGGMSIGGTITGGTTGSVLFINPTATLAQDNNSFFWNDTSKLLKLAAPSGIYLYNSVDTIDSPTNWERAVLDWNVTSNVFTIGTQKGGTGTLRDLRIFSGGQTVMARVPNVSGDNWFEDGAGNFTLSGYSNLGMGSSVLASVTSGFENVAIGSVNVSTAKSALQSLTSGSDNFALGAGALGRIVTTAYNTAIGAGALRSLGNTTDGNYNLVIGGNAFAALGDANVGGAATCDRNVGIGSSAGFNISLGRDNVFVGFQAGLGFSGNNNNDFNIAIGSNCLPSMTAGTQNIAIGPSFALNNVTSGNFNTSIGGWQGPSGAMNSVIALSDGNGNLRVDYNYTTASVWTFPFQITCTAAIKSTYHIQSVPVTYTGTSVTMGTTDNSIIINASGTFTLTLLGAAAYPGRILYVKSIAAQIVNSGSSNVVPIGSATAGNVIFPATAGKYTVLQSDGSNWITLASN